MATKVLNAGNGQNDEMRIHFETAGFDVITVSETWLTKDIGSNILELPEYQLFRCDRDHGGDKAGNIKKGGGLLMYVRKELKFTYIHEPKMNKSEESCELQLRSPHQKSIVLYNVYRPPNSLIDEFIKVLSDRVEDESEKSNCEIVFLGDFNINFKARASPEKKNLVAWQNKYGLKQLVKSETRCTRSSKTTIDLIFTNMEHCQLAGVIDLHMSDHQPVFVMKKKERDRRGKNDFKGRTYINYNKDLLSDSLTNAVKSNFNEAGDQNECWDRMENVQESFLNKNCLKKVFRTKSNTPVWVTREIIMAKDRDRAWKRAKETNRAEDWEVAKQFRNWANND